MSEAAAAAPSGRKTKGKKVRNKERYYPGSNQVIPESPSTATTTTTTTTPNSAEVLRSSSSEEVSTWTDFSIASPLERFAAFVESHLRKWGLAHNVAASGGVLSDAQGFVQSTEAVLNTRSYDLLFYWRPGVPAHNAVSVSDALVPAHFSPSMHAMMDYALDFPSDAHCLQRWFGVERFVLVCPRAGTVLDSSESTLLLSALAVAADACRCTVPLFVPLGDAWRGVYLGYECTQRGLVLRYDTRATKLAPEHAYLDGVQRLHFARVGFTPADHLATTIAARLTLEKETDESSGAWRGTEAYGLAAKPAKADGGDLTASTASETSEAGDKNDTANDDEGDEEEDEEETGVVWGQFADPVDVLQLGALWPRFTSDTFGDNEFGSELRPDDAPSWTVRSIYAEQLSFQLATNVSDVVHAHAGAADVRTLAELFVTDSVKKAIADNAAAAAGAVEQPAIGERTLRSAADALSRLAEPPVSASTSRRLLSGTLRTTIGAVSRVSSITKTLATSLHVEQLQLPGAERINMSLNNIFARAQSRCAESTSVAAPHLPPAPRLRGAKTGTLFFSFALSAYSLGRLRSIAMLWRQMASDLRWHWESGSPLVGVDECGGRNAIDLDQCLLQQKFNLLNYCIGRKRAQQQQHELQQQQQQQPSAVAAAAAAAAAEAEPTEGNGGWDEFDIDVPEGAAGDSSDAAAPPDTGADESRGRVRRLDLKLIGSEAPMYEPRTQDSGPATDDMLKEREEMLARLGTDSDAARLRTQLQTSGLLADMQAFKAANDNCALADFVRWHSPNDWVDGKLSARMSGEHNVWHELWTRAKPVRALDQKPLFDADKEANRALHYIETLSPGDLMTQVLATVLQGTPALLGWDCTDATRDALQLPSVRAAIEAMVATVARIWPTDRSESLTHEELETLLAAFRDAETRLMRATSLCQKLPRCAKLVEALLGDGEAAVESEEERAAVLALFSEAKTGRLPRDAQWREFVLRTVTPRAACGGGGRATLQRTYALVGRTEFRIGSVLCLDDGEEE
jgi:Rab3 GTPase-activating protein catalytic subunit